MADVKVRLSGYLPAAEMDGLQPLLQGLVDSPKDRRIIVAVIDTATRRDHGDGEYEPTVRILQVEAPTGELKDQAQELLHKAYAARTGAMQMFTGDDWGQGGQAGTPLSPDATAATALVGDQADPGAPDWEQPADDELADLQEQEGGDLDAALAAAAEEPAATPTIPDPFMEPEAPQPVQDQVAAKRGRKSTTTKTGS